MTRFMSWFEKDRDRANEVALDVEAWVARRIMENLSSKAAGRANGALATESGESEGDKAQRRGAENYERAANAPRKGAHA